MLQNIKIMSFLGMIVSTISVFGMNVQQYGGSTYTYSADYGSDYLEIDCQSGVSIVGRISCEFGNVDCSKDKGKEKRWLAIINATKVDQNVKNVREIKKKDIARILSVEGNDIVYSSLLVQTIAALKQFKLKKIVAFIPSKRLSFYKKNGFVEHQKTNSKAHSPKTSILVIKDL